MEKMKPKLFSVMKHYSVNQLSKDIVSGIIVAIIALPLSIALALASGVSPEQGIYTAIVAGFLISFLGGSRVQIAGPTAAFATIVAGIVAAKGMDGLVAATLIAAVILVIMGFLRVGSLIRFIPYTITTGFTAGIAITLFIGQIKDFLGLTIVTKEPLIETMDKLTAVVKNIHTVNFHALAVGVVSLLILFLWPKKLQKIPASLIAVIVGILMVKVGGLKALTIGDLYEISNKLPAFHMPKMSLALFRAEVNDGFVIAILAAIESLLSAVVADSMINSKHRSNMELVAQGIGNAGSVLFGGIPATGAIARTAANIKNGGRTPIAGMVHSITLVLILVLLMPYAALIPMATIAAILFQVAYNMSGYKKVVALCKTASKSDVFVLLVTMVLTVVFDLVVAIEVGFIAALVLFMKRISDETEINGWKYVDDEEDPDSLTLRRVPEKTLVYEISGPLFFGVADKIMQIAFAETDSCVVVRMRGVNAMDASAMHALQELYEDCVRKNVQLVFSHVNEQPRKVMEKDGFYEKIGAENFCPHIDEALERAEEIVNSQKI
nr:STAS domain-containing protein [Lachnospiraceae bacterium]